MSTPTSSDLHHQPRLGTLWMLASLACFTCNALLLKVLATSRHVDPWMSLTFRAGLGLVVSILLALFGLALLTGMAPGTLADFGKYETIGLVGALLAAAVVVVIRQLVRTESTATIFASQCVYSFLLAAPIAWLHFTPLNLGDVLLLSSAALCATFGQLSMTEGFRFLPVAAGGAFQNMVPVVITVCTVGLFAEPFTTVQAAGALLILWGSFQTVVGGRLPFRRMVRTQVPQ